MHQNLHRETTTILTFSKHGVLDAKGHAGAERQKYKIKRERGALHTHSLQSNNHIFQNNLNMCERKWLIQSQFTIHSYFCVYNDMTQCVTVTILLSLAVELFGKDATVALIDSIV